MLFFKKNATPSDKPYWDNIIEQVRLRQTTVKQIADDLEYDDFVASTEIAVTDIVVEIAREKLELRAKRMTQLAIFSALCALLIAGISLWHLFYKPQIFLIGDPLDPLKKIETQNLIAGILRNATIFGIILGMEYFLISLFRAFIHEATTFNNRVHSLRLGRLFIYLKYSSVDFDDLKVIRESITASEVERVFGWNIETSTAFRDINPEFATKSVWTNLSEAVGSIASKMKK